jgi:hypothetical protein
MDGKPRIAYFSMEIDLADAIPTYAGGLGILAGDTIRSAADPGPPMVAVSLLFTVLVRLRSLAEVRGPLQAIFAGKAHPRDLPGKGLAQEIHRVGRDWSINTSPRRTSSETQTPRRARGLGQASAPIGRIISCASARRDSRRSPPCRRAPRRSS